jgi:hypothetical protein
LIKDYAQLELTVVKEFYDHCNYWDWDRESYDDHLHMLANMRISTKLLEDMMGVLKDRNTRDSLKKEFQTHERVFFHNTQLQKRVNVEEWPVYHTEQSDISCYKTRKKSTGGWHFDQRLSNSTTKRGWEKTDLTRQMMHIEKHNIHVKPTGHLADFRSVAASVIFTELYPKRMEGCDTVWATALLAEGHVFRAKGNDQRHIMSMRCEHGAAFGFELEKNAGRPYFVPMQYGYATTTEAISRIKPMVVTRLAKPEEEGTDANPEEYVAVPTRPGPRLS